MGRRRSSHRDPKSQTLPPSPSHSFSSSSSSDFEFTISLSPLKSSSCPADELFYKGKLLPLHLSPRLSMVRTLLLASSSSSSCSTNTTTSPRDSTESSTSTELSLYPECDSSRPSSVTEEDEFKRLNTRDYAKKPKYFSLARFSSVFKKDQKNKDQDTGSSSVKRMSTSIRKYLKKVKPLYEKISQKQQQQEQKIAAITERSVKTSGSNTRKDNNGVFSYSFSGNLRYPRKRNCVSGCPSSMRSSPSHYGVLNRDKVVSGSMGYTVPSSSSSMEELQNAIQGAAHCKNSMVRGGSELGTSNPTAEPQTRKRIGGADIRQSIGGGYGF